MKKITTLSLITASFLSLGLLTSCNSGNEKVNLTFGSYIDNGAYLVDYAELTTRLNRKESMLITVYPGDDSTCSCWTMFSSIIDKASIDNILRIYKISYATLLGNGNPWGFTLANDSPTFHIVENGEIKTRVDYDTTNENYFIYKSDSSFYDYVVNNCNFPSMIYADLNYVDNLIDNKSTFDVYYGRNRCGDCGYVEPNFLYKKAGLKNKLLVVDVQPLYETRNESDDYINFKNNYGLTEAGNSTYGYITGVVPTFQHIKNGEIYDASVFFNDSVSLVDGKYVVTETFYTTKRAANLHYLDKIKGGAMTVLEGLELSEDDVEIYPEYNNYIAWKQESAYNYHAPLLQAFFDTYLM